MRKVLSLLAVVALAGCGADYAPNNDLPGVDGAPVVANPKPTSPVGVCATCATDADCGPNSFCIPESDTAQTYCTAPCASDGTCSSGQSCMTLYDASNNPIGSGCYPSNLSCVNPPVQVTTGGTTSGGTTTGSSTSGTTTGGTTTGSSTSGTTTGGNTCTDTWSNYGSSFFSTNCAGCHSWAGSHSYVQSDLSSIKSRISSGSMPQGRTLSSSDKTRVLAYLNCGAP